MKKQNNPIENNVTINPKTATPATYIASGKEMPDVMRETYQNIADTVNSVRNIDTVIDVVSPKDGLLKTNIVFKSKVSGQTSFMLTNKRAIESYLIIDNLKKISDRSDLAICYELAQLKNCSAFGDLKVEDVARVQWNISKRTCDAYIKIGTHFIDKDHANLKDSMGNDIMDENGKPKVRVIYHPKDVFPQSLNRSHLLEFNAYINEYTLDDFETLYLNGTLRDGMSTKDIRQALKTAFGKAVNDEQSANEKTKEKSEVKADNETQEIRIADLSKEEIVEESRKTTLKLINILDLMEDDYSDVVELLKNRILV